MLLAEKLLTEKSNKKDKDDIRVHAKIIYDKDIMKLAYKAETEEEIHKAIFDRIKDLNETMPAYKGIKGIILSEKPLIKTTTNKIKRQEEMKTIEQ